MPLKKPFAEIGSLKVKTVGTGPNRVKVVLLPGHEYKLRHFLPRNLNTVPDHVAPIGPRTRFVDGIDGARFVVKHLRPERHTERLTPVSEAKLARYINGLNINWLRAEQPLAIHLRQNGHHEVIYRLLKPKGRLAADSTLAWFFIKDALRKHDIFPGGDVGQNVIEDKDGFHFFDLEEWEVHEELRKKLGLKLAPKNL